MNGAKDPREQLAGEIRSVAEQAEELMLAQGHALAEKTKDIRDRLADVLETAQQTLRALEDRTEESLKTADRTVRSHPYQAIGVALGIGLVLGLLIKRK